MTREKEMYVDASNFMIECSTPEELERFAVLEQEDQDLKAQVQAMLDTARDRKLTEEPTFPELRKASGALIKIFDLNEPEAIAWMDLEELERFMELGNRLYRARVECLEMMKATVGRVLGL
jgi:hypothetical protein